MHAKRIHLPSQQYEFTEDGRALTTFPLGRGSTGARFTLHGVDHLVRTHAPPVSGPCDGLVPALGQPDDRDASVRLLRRAVKLSLDLGSAAASLRSSRPSRR